MNPNYKPNLSVIIPAYNENGTIDKLLDVSLDLARDNNWEIIVVDDGSTDGTAESVQQRSDSKNLKLLIHKRNRGYGASLKTGIHASNASRIATIDADGQHNPSDLIRLFPLLDEYELIVGTRTNPFHSPLYRMPGKWILKWLADYSPDTVT